MGRGDKKTKKGKISMGSYGVLRPKEKNKVTVSAKPAKKAAPKKEAAAPKATKAKPAAKKAEVKAK